MPQVRHRRCLDVCLFELHQCQGEQVGGERMMTRRMRQRMRKKERQGSHLEVQQVQQREYLDSAVHASHALLVSLCLVVVVAFAVEPPHPRRAH